MTGTEAIAVHDAAKALTHPLRASLLKALDGKVKSPSNLADESQELLGNVSHHTRVLRDLGLIRLVRTEPRRGATEHYYTANYRIHLQVEPVE